MTAPPQQQHLTPGDHQYFEWSNRKNFYPYSEDNQMKQNTPLTHVKKKQKINGNDEHDHLSVRKIIYFERKTNVLSL